MKIFTAEHTSYFISTSAQFIDALSCKNDEKYIQYKAEQSQMYLYVYNEGKDNIIIAYQATQTGLNNLNKNIAIGIGEILLNSGKVISQS